jgi:hypothetical protein
MDRLEFIRKISGLVYIGAFDGCFMESKSWMVTLVGEEWRNTSGCVRSIVERKLPERKKLGPIVLVICTIHADVLLEGLIHLFCLSVGLWMVTGGKVHRHVEKFAQCTEESGYEFRSSVRCDVGRNSVFGENVNEEEPSELNRHNMPITSKQDNLLGCTVNDDTDAIKLAGIWEEFNEVNGY